MSTDWGHFCDEERICVIVPTYNNERTIADVLQRIQVYTYNIIVVNDGSTPETLAAVRSLSEIPEIVDYTPNRGKGYALMQGFRRALEPVINTLLPSILTDSISRRTSPCCWSVSNGIKVH